MRNFLQNSIGNSSTSTTYNASYIAKTILQLQITMVFYRPHMYEKQLKSHLQCGTDPTIIRPHTTPSCNRRNAEVDYRGSGDGLCTGKHKFRASAIFQKRISYETSFKNSIGNSSTSTTLQYHLHYGNDPTVTNHNGMPSAIHPPASLAIPFTLRERSYNYKSQWYSFHH